MITVAPEDNPDARNKKPVILRTRIDLDYLCSFLLYKFHKVLIHCVIYVVC